MVLGLWRFLRPLHVSALDNFNLVRIGQNMSKSIPSTSNKINNYLSELLGFT